MAEPYMNYYHHEYSIITALDFERIKWQLVEADLINQEDIATILNSSKYKIKQNICLLKLLFEARKDFAPFLEILQGDTTLRQHVKIAERIGEPEYTVRNNREKKIYHEIKGEMMSEELYMNMEYSTRKVMDVFNELVFIPKLEGLEEKKEDNESGIFSDDSEFSPDSESSFKLSLNEENNTSVSDYGLNSIPHENVGCMNLHDKSTTLEMNRTNYWKAQLMQYMPSFLNKRLRQRCLHTSILIVGMVVTYVVLPQPFSWMHTLFKSNSTYTFRT